VGPPGVEADEVDGGGGEGVFEFDFGTSGVAGLADACDGDGLADGAFDPGAGAVGVFPRVGGLIGTGLLERLVQMSGRRVMTRRRCCEVVHSARAGQTMHAPSGNATVMTSCPSW
jgi:hypothetical protein